MTRNPASASGPICRRQPYQNSGNPCSRTTGGPAGSPAVTAWSRTPSPGSRRLGGRVIGASIGADRVPVRLARPVPGFAGNGPGCYAGAQPTLSRPATEGASMPPAFDVADRIDGWRQQLLDTSRRNRLVSFRSGRGGGVDLA